MTPSCLTVQMKKIGSIIIINISYRLLLHYEIIGSFYFLLFTCLYYAIFYNKHAIIVQKSYT